MNMIVSILVIAGLLFGGGATVNAAQNDLPNEPLYALKLWSENLHVQLQNDPEAKVASLMQMAQTRIQEMDRLATAGKPVPDAMRQQIQQHLQQVLQLCTSMDDAALDRTLLQVRDHLQQMDRDMDRLQLHTQSQDTLQLLNQTRTMLHERQQLVEDGLLNHDMFRYAVQNGVQYGPENVTAPAQNQNQQQNGQPTSVPGGADVTPGGPNGYSGGDTLTPGGPNLDPGGPNPDSGGSNSGSGGTDTSGNGTGGNGSGPGGNGTGGNRP